MGKREKLTRFAWLSIVTAVFTIFLKATAYWLTGSVGLLSDALESGVNLATAVFALLILTIAARPPDEEHAYGHSKAEYFAGGVEGGLIMAAALIIAVTAVPRLIHPQPLEQLGLGLVVSVVAAAANGLTAFILLRAGRQYRSLTLTADGRHLLTDVWTTGGVLLGLAVVYLTGWLRLDALIALAVAAQITYTGFGLLREAVNGLMDVALPDEEVAVVTAVLDSFVERGIQYHALRTRRSGAQRFASVHIQVPGDWSVQQGHALMEEIEGALYGRLAPITIITHLEPLEDPVSWKDIPLNREFG
ncbi:MAG: cation transporter [Chloroflexi bacterium]|nr:cation transporter [Ardenticatenaceae bacterium]MBL1130562.1 cation transporter [Chloroflexota bacterium]NOG36652.1 cation transporter [Chloroflexota bacterium]